MKRPFRGPRISLKYVSATLGLSLLAVSSLLASPRDPTVLQGTVSIQQTESTTQITASNGAIIDWGEFSVQSGEDVSIILPDASSSLLNRVRGPGATQILGRVESNGQLFLINQEGIYVGPGGRVACQELTASTISITETQFLKGKGFFLKEQEGGTFVNDGTIECENNIVLASSSIKNTNTVKSTSGTVCLAAGESVYVKGDLPPATAYITWSDTPTTIENSGTIEGQLVLLRSHGNSLVNTITNDGRIIARAENELGVVVHADEGRLINTGSVEANGGGITMIGKRVVLTDSAVIDGSGPNGGGNISIGGGWGGKDPEVPNADEVFIARGANIITNATVDGHGGNVVVWANGKNEFFGMIAANGVGKSGNGGNAEVSAKNTLMFDGSASLTSEHGKQGEILLDPASITIQASSPNIDGLGLGHDITTANELQNPTTFPGVASIITAGAVNSLLTGGVTMTLSADNFITVNAPVTASGTVTALILNAPTLNLNSAISLPSGGTLSGSATVVNVGPSGIIQNGVDAVASGGTVNLASAAYTQEVNMGKNLTLNGNGIGNTTIVCPATLLTNTFTAFGNTYHPFVMATGGVSTINIQNLTIDGNSQNSNFLNYQFLGIGYYDAGGTVSHVRATGVQDSSPAGATQHGQAIFGAIDDGNPYTIQVLNCTVDNFQKAAIAMRGPTLTTIISGNTITGETPPSPATANGITIQRDTSATITNNTITNIHCTVFPSNESVGILLINPGNNTTVANNTSNSNDLGIYCDATSSNLQINNNTANDNADTGIVVMNSTGPNPNPFYISNNSMTNNVNCDMSLTSAANQAFDLSTNKFIGSQDGLILTGYGAMGPVVTMDHDSFVGQTQYYIELVSDSNNLWPSTSTVSFDGLVTGQMTYAQFEQVLSKIVGKHVNLDLGLVLVFVPPTPPSDPPLPPRHFDGTVKRRHHPTFGKHFVLRAHWMKSPSANIVLYRIYVNGKLWKKISNKEEFSFHTHRHTSHVHKKYQITAVSSGGFESIKIPLRISEDVKDL